MLTASEERELLERAQRGDRRAIDALIASHMRLVVSIAGRHARGSLSPHDLIAEGAVGLLEAIQRHDCTRDTRFSSYAVFWVRAFVSRYALANRRIVGASSTRAGRKTRARLRSAERELTRKLGRFPSRAELAQELEVDEREVQVADGPACDLSLSQEGAAEQADPAPSPEALVADTELRALRQGSVARALDLLSAKEHSVVCQHMAEARSLAEIARELGVSRQRTGQIMANARAKLRGQLEQVA